MFPQQASPPAGAGPPAEPARPGPGADEPSLIDSLREELGAALAGAEIGRQDRHFLSRLTTWHRANADPVVALLWKARLAGRTEASMTPQELDTVIGALRDAARYRESGADTMGCWDCENVIGGGRCEEHSKDFDKARDCLSLARVLAAIRGAAAKSPSGPSVTMKGVAATAAAGVLAAPVGPSASGPSGSGLAAGLPAPGHPAGKIAAKVHPGRAGRRTGIPQQRGATAAG
jgi:hypothetical protein